MSVRKSIVQVFENNMGNRITPELAAGVQPQTDESQQPAQEKNNGVV